MGEKNIVPMIKSFLLCTFIFQIGSYGSFVRLIFLGRLTYGI